MENPATNAIQDIVGILRLRHANVLPSALQWDMNAELGISAELLLFAEHVLEI